MTSPTDNISRVTKLEKKYYPLGAWVCIKRSGWDCSVLSLEVITLNNGDITFRVSLNGDHTVCFTVDYFNNYQDALKYYDKRLKKNDCCMNYILIIYRSMSYRL